MRTIGNEGLQTICQYVLHLIGISKRYANLDRLSWLVTHSHYPLLATQLAYTEALHIMHQTQQESLQPSGQATPLVCSEEV